MKLKVGQLKTGKGFEQTFLQGKYTNDQSAHEKIPNLIRHQGNLK
jgi:hypothetical protein